AAVADLRAAPARAPAGTRTASGSDRGSPGSRPGGPGTTPGGRGLALSRRAYPARRRRAVRSTTGEIAMKSHSRRAVAPGSLLPVRRTWPDAFGRVLHDDTRVILCLDPAVARAQNLCRLGQVWPNVADDAAVLCVSMDCPLPDIRTIEWLEEE